ncbi:MAG: hypothetical protein IPG98_08880 [Burkholderiales bacterium]|nr:hypothetical protein [Burkholderiales bacterium]MBK8666147.1 hypothetical protein [Burkholderiales bacterium]
MQAIDAQSKGQPAGHTLFCLWARSPDHPLVIIENPATFAHEAGFDGNRAVDTWRRRMKRLVELHFIMNKKGPSGDFHYVLLMNPNAAMEAMKINNLAQTDLYARFIDRLTDVGGYREIESLHALWQRTREQQAAEQAKAATAAATVASPPASETAAPGTTPEAVGAAPVKRQIRKRPQEHDESEPSTAASKPARVRRRGAAGA